MRKPKRVSLRRAIRQCRRACDVSVRAAETLERCEALSVGAERDALLVAAFDDLNVARDLRQNAQHEIVSALRADGHSWQAVGQLLGTTRQAAWRRFGSDLDYGG